VEARLRVSPRIEIVKPSLREQYDTYFLFDDAEMGRIRYREDNVITTESEDDLIWGGELKVEPVYTLTLMGPASEREYANSVILTRSRFTCVAPHSLRFYREFFSPASETEVIKRRRRFRILFDGVEFAINLDRLLKPDLPGTFLEVKSRTWSERDAEQKADMVTDLLRELGVEANEVIKSEYLGLG
jgi:5-methylthioadenosine/S-adenosylhomocysteine deaminase